MSNYNPVSYENADYQTRAVYDEVRNALGEQSLPNWLTHLGEMPDVLKSSWELLKSIMLKGKLSPLLQDLIFYTVAYHRTVPYCMALHGANIIRMTKVLSAQDLEAIAKGNHRGFLPDKYHSAIQLAAKLSTLQCGLEAQDFNDLRLAGFSHAEAMEITLLVSIAMFFNTYTFAANLPVDAENEAFYLREQAIS